MTLTQNMIIIIYSSSDINNLFLYYSELCSDKCSLEHVPAVNLISGFAIEAELPRANYNWYLSY